MFLIINNYNFFHCYKLNNTMRVNFSKESFNKVMVQHSASKVPTLLDSMKKSMLGVDVKPEEEALPLEFSNEVIAY